MPLCLYDTKSINITIGILRTDNTRETKGHMRECLSFSSLFGFVGFSFVTATDYSPHSSQSHLLNLKWDLVTPLFTLSNGFPLEAEYNPDALPGAATASPSSFSAHLSRRTAFILPISRPSPPLVLHSLPPAHQSQGLPKLPGLSVLLGFLLSGIMLVSCLPLSEYQLGEVRNFALSMLEEKVKK